MEEENPEEFPDGRFSRNSVEDAFKHFERDSSRNYARESFGSSIRHYFILSDISLDLAKMSYTPHFVI